MSPSLTVFINTSLKTGLIISDWKRANVPPVHKKGPRVDVTNFRPISLQSIVSKIQEKCVVRVFFPFVIKIIHTMQYGFQPGSSCASQLLDVFHKIAKSLEKGFEVDIIYLDFSKAFDSVCHDKLLWKLQDTGIDGSLLHWFRN